MGTTLTALSSAYVRHRHSQALNLAQVPPTTLAAKPPFPADSFPRLSLAKALAEEVEYANDILRGHVELFGRRVDLTAHSRWHDSRDRERSRSFALHAMQWLDPLLTAHRVTGDAAYLRRGEQLIFSWIDQNSGYVLRPPSEFILNDHATALRALAWVRFWATWRTSHLWHEHKAAPFFSSLFAHAARLADPHFYTRRHNHGIDQDIALLAIAAAFRQHPRSHEWSDLALRRVKEQIVFLVSANGVQREHSPAYQLSTLSHLHELARFCALLNTPIEVYGRPLPAVVRDMAEVASYFVTPQRTLAPIGDTDPASALTEDHPIVRQVVGLSPAAEFAISAGSRGTPPPEITSLKEDGYVVVRRWGKGSFTHGLYLLFTAASNEAAAHKHLDDLSFVLYACGKLLIDEGGNVSYQHDEQRRFVVGPYAHNSVVFGDGSSPPYITGSGLARLTSATRGEGYIELSGVSDQNPLYRHERTLRLYEEGVLRIIDRVTPKGPDTPETDIQRLLNIGRGLQAEVSAANSVRVHDANGTVLEIAADTQVRIVSGQRKPMIGWRAERFGFPLVAAPTVIMHRRAKVATMSTELRFRTCS